MRILKWLSFIVVVPFFLLLGCTQPNGSAIILVFQGTTEIESGDTYDFGSVVVGTQSAPVAFTIKNIGTAPASLTGSSALSITGSAAADYSATAQPSKFIAAGESDTFEVVWSPLTAATETAQITLSSDAGTYTLTLTGTGTSSGQLQVEYNGDGFLTLSDGGSAWFPSLYSSTDIAYFIFRVTNNDPSAPLVLVGDTPTITNDTGAFSITSRPHSTVPHGGYTDFLIQFSWVGNGTYAETVTLKTSDPTTPVFTFTVTGDQILN